MSVERRCMVKGDRFWCICVRTATINISHMKLWNVLTLQWWMIQTHEMQRDRQLMWQHLLQNRSRIICDYCDHTVQSMTHTIYNQKSTSIPRKLHVQPSAAVTHCLIVATHFSDLWSMESLVASALLLLLLFGWVRTKDHLCIDVDSLARYKCNSHIVSYHIISYHIIITIYKV